jgi:hypothetical protein
LWDFGRWMEMERGYDCRGGGVIESIRAFVSCRLLFNIGTLHPLKRMVEQH